jgi:hypothetical protein
LQNHLDSAFSVYKLLQSSGSLLAFFLTPLLSLPVNIGFVSIYVLAAFGGIVYLHFAAQQLEKTYVRRSVACPSHLEVSQSGSSIIFEIPILVFPSSPAVDKQMYQAISNDV